MNKMMKATLSAGALLGLAGAAQAGIGVAGPILGPLGPGSSVNGDTTTSTNDNNGGSTNGLGTPGGSWSGNDDVYALNWPGGTITINLLFSHAASDLDLYLINSTGDGLLAFSESTTDNETIGPGTLAAGSYFIMVDGWQGANGAYTLNVVPTPAAAGLLGMAGLAGLSRRRRA